MIRILYLLVITAVVSSFCAWLTGHESDRAYKAGLAKGRLETRDTIYLPRRIEFDRGVSAYFDSKTHVLRITCPQ